MTHVHAAHEEMRLALKAGRRRRSSDRRAVSVRYDAVRDAIEIGLTDGATVRLPWSAIGEFAGIPVADMSGLRVSPAGYGIELDSSDIAISVQGLVAELPTNGDMASSFGKLDGAARSAAKRATAWVNGLRMGGRESLGWLVDR